MLASILGGLRVLHQQVTDVRRAHAEVRAEYADIERQMKALDARIERAKP